MCYRYESDLIDNLNARYKIVARIVELRERQCWNVRRFVTCVGWIYLRLTCWGWVWERPGGWGEKWQKWGDASDTEDEDEDEDKYEDEAEGEDETKGEEECEEEYEEYEEEYEEENNGISEVQEMEDVEYREWEYH